MRIENGGQLCGRRLAILRSVCGKELGYESEQTDTFAIHYPMNYDETRKYPLYVVFHSAGHDVYSALSCLLSKGNHDIYHTPDDMFGLFLDCRANMSNDWWWGGINALGQGDPKLHDGIQPVERRCIATVEWMIKNYNVDDDRVYAVGNSMGGSGALGIALCRGDIFAAIKANVPAGVRHAADRSFLDREAESCLEIPDPPIVVDYSAQNDGWSKGHDELYRGMREKRYALHGYWGEFGHANNNNAIAEKNDLVHGIPVLSVKRSEPYPVFTNASTDDRNPWENTDCAVASGQVNGFFRFENIKDTENELEMELWMLTPDEIETRISLPEVSNADILIRRVKNFKLSPFEEFSWTLGSDGIVTIGGISAADRQGHPCIDGITLKQKRQTLVLKRI